MTANPGTLDLRRFKISQIPSIYYIPEYIGKEEEKATTQHVKGLKLPWSEVKGRRVQSLGGRVEQGILLQTLLPRWLQSLLERVSRTCDSKPNHVLLNAYQVGQGIYSHQDGPIYHPVVCILSLGGSAVVNFRQKLEGGGYEVEPSAAVLLQPRSLLVFCEDAYLTCLHGIDEVTEDVMHAGVANLALAGVERGAFIHREAERLSLTFRKVLKTRKLVMRV